MNNQSIGARIRELRESSGMQAKELAEQMDLDASVITKLEQGLRALKADELVKISNLLGISPISILAPDSLLGRLPLAARSAEGRPNGEVTRRLTALAEYHDLLKRNNLNSEISFTPLESVFTSNEPRTANLAKRVASSISNEIQFDVSKSRLEQLADIAENSFGIDVMIDTCLETDTIGASITDAEFPIAWVNASQSATRALFTLAHELGHIFASDGVTLNEEKTLDGSEPNEVFSNTFAAEILMPENEVKILFEKFGRTTEALATMLNTFEVSFQSLIYRLHNLRILSNEGRDAFLQLRLGGLIQLINDKSIVERLHELQSQTVAVRAPGLLTSRMMKGARNGVLGLRALSSVSNRDVDELEDLLFGEVESNTAGDFEIFIKFPIEAEETGKFESMSA